MIHCKLCQQLNANNNGADAQLQPNFANLDELEAHLASDHFNCLPYECEQCQFAKFPTEFAVMKHNEQDHGNKHYMFRCRITPFIRSKRLKIRELLLAWTGGHNAKVSGEQIIVKNGVQSSFDDQPPKLKPSTNPSPSICSSSPADNTNCCAGLSSKNSNTVQRTGQQAVKNEITEDGLPDQQNCSHPSENDHGQQFDCEFNNVDQMKQFQEHNGEEQEDESNDAMDFGEADVASTPTSSLLEQIQATAYGKHNKKARNWSGKTSTTSFGGTMEIKEGRELSASFLSLLAGGELQHDDEMAENQSNKDNSEDVESRQLPKEEIIADANASSTAAAVNFNNRYMLRQKNRHVPSFLHHKQQANKAQQMANNLAKPIQFKGYKLPVARIKCRKCGEMVNCSGGCLMHHVNTRHMRFPLFQCKQCHIDFYEVSNTRIHKHMRIHHKGDTSNLVSNYLKYTALLHDARDECFGSRTERQNAIRQGQLRFAQLQQHHSFKPKAAGKIVNSKLSSSMPILTSKSAEQTCAAVRAILQKTNEVVQQQKQFNDDDEGAADCYTGDDLKLNEIQRMFDHGDVDEEYEAGDVPPLTAEGNQIVADHLSSSSASFLASTFDYKPLFLNSDQQNWNVTEVPSTSVQNNGRKGSANGTLKMNQQQQRNSRNSSSFADSDTNRNDNVPDNQQFPQQQVQHLCDDKVPCKACGEMVFNKILNRLNHVNVRHLHLPLHQCRICQKPFTSYSRSACYSHVQFAHRADLESGQYSPNIDEHIIYMKEHYEKQLVEASYGYFPFGVL